MAKAGYERDGIEVVVECTAGYRGEESPRRLLYGAHWIDLVEILDRWLAPDHRYFSARSEEGGRFLLRHDAAVDRWQIMLYEERFEH